MAGDAETGVMVMQMDEGLDTGPVLMAEKVAIGRKTSGELADAAVAAGRRFDGAGAERAGAGRGDGPSRRASDGVTYAKKITKEEARIDWSKSAAEIDCLIRGLSPAPGAFSEVKGERLKILYAVPVAGKGAPGEIIGDDLTVACGEGALKVAESAARRRQGHGGGANC